MRRLPANSEKIIGTGNDTLVTVDTITMAAGCRSLKRCATTIGLKPGMKILDVGCGKGFLLHEFMQAVPGIEVRGIDVSQYGIDNAKPEVSTFLSVGNATDLPCDTDEFDFVVALGMLHNLYNYDLHKALQEIERVGRNAKYVMVEGYRNEHEKANLLYWQLTCRAFHTPAEWEWTFAQAGYTGDYGCIFFE